MLRSVADKLKKREKKWNRDRDIAIARDPNLSDLDNSHRDKAIAIVKGQSHSKKGRACLIPARSNKKKCDAVDWEQTKTKIKLLSYYQLFFPQKAAIKSNFLSYMYVIICTY